MTELKKAARAATTGQFRKSTEHSGGMTFYLGNDFLAFQGHFPGYPLLPAFVQVLLAVVVAEGLKQKPMRLIGVQNAKFQNEIRPGATIDVECTEVSAPPDYAFQARLTDDKLTFASFLIKCADAKEKTT